MRLVKLHGRAGSFGDIPTAAGGGYIRGLIQEQAHPTADGFERSFGTSRGDPVTAGERHDLALDQKRGRGLQVIARMLTGRGGFGKDGIEPSVNRGAFRVGRGAVVVGVLRARFSSLAVSPS